MSRCLVHVRYCKVIKFGRGFNRAKLANWPKSIFLAKLNPWPKIFAIIWGILLLIVAGNMIFTYVRSFAICTLSEVACTHVSDNLLAKKSKITSVCIELKWHFPVLLI